MRNCGSSAGDHGSTLSEFAGKIRTGAKARSSTLCPAEWKHLYPLQLLARFENEAQAATVWHTRVLISGPPFLSQMQTAKLSTAIVNTISLAGIPGRPGSRSFLHNGIFPGPGIRC
jgi:hypothetical protein